MDLNQKQQEAVDYQDGPLMILAGAGSGKTKTITARIVALVKLGVAPQNILAITFTNKAAKEMRERAMTLLSSDPLLNNPISFAERPFISTFHSLGVRIIKDNAALLGLTKNFVIFDRDDSKKVIKRGLENAGLDPKQFEPGKILSIISREKGNGVTLADFQLAVGNDYMKSVVKKVWSFYDETLKKEKALDFDDLLLKAVGLLKNNPKVREYYQKLWQYIHIDEYQDTNEVQYQMAKILAEQHRNVCVVGDIDQMIYSWRGADIENILNFENDYPEAKVIVLEQNYRSTQNILGAANNVIIKNKNRKEKRMFTENEKGEKVSVYNAFDERDEARFVARTCCSLIAEGVQAEQIAVLYRTNFQSRALEEGMMSVGVDYDLIGTRFYERKEIKDVLSYVRYALNPDSISDLTRIINTPTRGIGKVGLLKIVEGKSNELSGKQQEAFASFQKFIVRLQKKIEMARPSEVIKFVLKDSGLETELSKDKTDGMERIQNIQELVSLATKYDAMPQGEGMEKMLEETALASDQDELEEKGKSKAVKLMTVHASKGLEFDFVFVTGLEDGLFPSRRLDEENRDEEEERRLMYVAVTRASKKIFLTSAQMRMIFGQRNLAIQSEFVADVGEEYLEIVGGDGEIIGGGDEEIEYDVEGGNGTGKGVGGGHVKRDFLIEF